MKLTLLFPALVLGLVISSSSETFAFGGPPGGPFSNGSYFPNDGTFSAVVRGENLTGTLQFSTSSNASSTGVSTIFYDGDTYLGNSQGVINPTDSTMTLDFQASAQGQGEQTININVLYTTNSTSNGTTTSSQQTIPLKTVNYFDVKSIEGFANCKTTNAFPNQKLKGQGQATVEQLDFGSGNYDPVIVKSKPFFLSVSGVRLSNTSSSFITSEIRPPSVSVTTFLLTPQTLN
jgi:hypothetical protein